MTAFKIAVLPGDGIGKEVVPEGVRVLDAVGRKYDVSLGMVARERPEPAKTESIKIGDSIETSGNQRRRLTLPDG